MKTGNEKQETAQRFESVYREHRKGFLARARQSSARDIDAEDILHDVAALAMTNLEALGQVTNLKAWIHAAIRNRVIDLWRRRAMKKRAGETDLANETIDEIVAATGLDPQDEFVRSELVEALGDAIDQLPEPQRQVIYAQVYDGVSFRELSEATGVALDTLAARKRHAITALGKALRDWIDD